MTMGKASTDKTDAIPLLSVLSLHAEKFDGGLPHRHTSPRITLSSEQ